MPWISAVAVDESGIRLGNHFCEWSTVEEVSCLNVLLAGRVSVRLADGTRRAAWGSASAAKACHRSLLEGLNACATRSKLRVLDATAKLQAFLDRDCYLSQWHVARFQAETSDLPELLRIATRLSRLGDSDAAHFVGSIASLPVTIASRNETWSAAEQDRWRPLFDTVEATPLTSEQRKAVVAFESRNLLVAAAGSGKSSTLVAKVAYAVQKGLVRPEQVLALAFNNRAARELRDRIAYRLGDIRGSEAIRSETFHALGYRILAEDRRPNVLDDRSKLIADVYQRLRSEDESFGREVNRFILQFTPDLRDQSEFSSYEEYLEYLRCQQARPGDRTRRVPTLSGHHVASAQEMKIANWLFINGIRFEYEKTYPFVEATKERRVYTPDFYLPDIDAWYEHFGVDANGRPPSFFQDPNEYIAGMKWKQECHRTNGTKLIETTSAMFMDGSIFVTLERMLREHGQRFKSLSISEVDALVGTGPHKDFAALLSAFITHWKSRGVTFEQLMEQGSARDRAFLPICRRVYEEYERHLERERRVDFEDLITKATDRVRRGDWASPFKLILVDEFQDISTERAALLRALLAQHDDAVLFCVGDDWQAINGFAGSELAIMRNFEREFGKCVVNYLTRTFRSNQGISTKAKDFVERNPDQLRKAVVSHDGNVEDCIRIIRYYGESDHLARYEEIAKELTSAGRPSVRIMGRYRRQERRTVLDAFRKQGRDIEAEYGTVHSSKGLEADYVVLDRVEGPGPYSFPSIVLDDSVLRLVVPEREAFPNAEERRLMYVALTRARHRVYIVTQRGNESTFVRELEGAGSAETEPVYACPHCKGGVRVVRTSKFGQFWGCSRYPDCTSTSPKK